MPNARSLAGYFKQATISNAVQTLVDAGFTAAQVADADRVIISVESGALRAIWDQALTAPTTSTGMLIPTTNYPHYVIEGRTNAMRLKMIRNGSSTDCVVNIMIESD